MYANSTLYPQPPPPGQGAQNGHFHNHENFWVPHVLVFSMVINLLQSFEILQNLAADLGPVLALYFIETRIQVAIFSKVGEVNLNRTKLNMYGVISSRR